MAELKKCKIQSFSTAILLIGFFALSLPNVGCSVGMAMSGKKEPNLGTVRVGATRGEVELQLGSPVSSVTTEGGRRLDSYEYEIGNEPSGGRAVGHAVMDVLTLGAGEIIGTPVEGFQRKKYRLALAYDNEDRVAAINQPTTSVPPINNENTDSTSLKNTDSLQSNLVLTPSQKMLYPLKKN